MAHMEEVLDLYEEPYDPRRPVVCFDETSTQLLADTRTSLPSWNHGMLDPNVITGSWQPLQHSAGLAFV